MSTTVYTLSSSRNSEVRYVGQTTQTIAARLRQHRSDSSVRCSTPVRKWIAREIAAGFEIMINAVVTDANLHATEIEIIAKYRAQGYRLLNITNGGEGTLGFSHVGRKRPDLANRNRANRGKTGHSVSEEAKAKISAANTGRKKPWLAERNRLLAGIPGHPHTAASRAAISAKLKGREIDDDWRKKISESKKRANHV